MKTPTTYSRLLCLAALLSLAPSLTAQNTWIGTGNPPGNWSVGANWFFGSPPSEFDQVLFDNVAAATNAGSIDNIVNIPFKIGSLQYSTASTNGFHTTLINPGLSLDIKNEGTPGNTIFVGTGVAQNNESIYSRWIGGGTLTVTNTFGAINVHQVGAAADHYATLDLSGLTNFSASMDQVLVGAATFVSGFIRPMGIVRLAETNWLQTAAGTTKPGIMVAAYPGSDTNVRGTQQLFLGQHNIISSDVISMGGHKSVGQILSKSGATNAYALFRGSAGGTDRVKLITVGDPRARIVDLTGGGTGTGSTGTFNLTGTAIDLSIIDLIVARNQTTGTGNSTGTMTVDQGTIDADNLYVAYHTTGTTAAGNSTGTLNVNGTATVTVNNDLVMARKVGSGVPVATLNIASNATVNVKGNLLTSGGTSTINNAGLIDLQPAGDATKGDATFGTLTGAGVITNANNVTNTVAITPGGTLTAGTISIYGNLTFATNSVYNYNLSSVSTPGAGVNDLVSVDGNLTLNSNVVNFVPFGSSLALNSPYRLIDYTGTRTGFLNFTNTTRYLAALDYSTANQVDLLVTGGAPGAVRCNSLTNSAWDVVATNWVNTGSALPDKFFQLDSVLIDDSGSYTNLLLIANNVFPSDITVNSSTRDYVVGGAGRIGAGASLTKSGTSMLTISNAHDFAGPVQVNAGTLRVMNAGSLGDTNGGTTIVNGATLDVFGAAFYNPGEWIVASGAGLNNTGAVINTGANQNNAIRFLTLAGDTTINAVNRFDVRGPGGNNSFSGLLDLGGFTLTKLGAAQHSWADAVVTNAGNIEIVSGILGFTRSALGGPGFVNLNTNMLFIENSSTGYIAKPLVLSGGTIRATGSFMGIEAPITNNLPGMVFDVANTGTNTYALAISNVIVGPGYLVKSNSGGVLLATSNPYTGATVVQSGTLRLGPAGAIPNTPSISLGTGSGSGTLDVAEVAGGFTLLPGQTLGGRGSVLGNVNATTGSGIVPGTSTAILTFSNNLAMADTSLNTFELGEDPASLTGTNNDLVYVAGNLDLSGVNQIKINPLAALNNTTPYTLFQVTGTITGTAANLDVNSDSRYQFTPSIVANAVQVSVVGSGTAASLVWAGGANPNPTLWDNKVTPNWLNVATPDLFFQGDSVTFNNSATTGSVLVNSTVQPSTVTVDNSSLPYTVTGSGSIQGGVFSKSGGAALTFANAGANSFAGAASLTGGTTRLQNAGGNLFALGASLTGATLALEAGGNSFLGPVSLNNSTLIVANLANTFSGLVTLNSSSLIFDQPGTATFAATLADDVATPGTITKRGVNTTTISSNNTNFFGNTLIENGVLRAANQWALGNGNTPFSIFVTNTGTLDINAQALRNAGKFAVISGAGLSSTGVVINTGAEQQNAIGGLSLASHATIAAWGSRWDVRGPGGASTYSGLLSLNGYTLTKVGPGQISVVDSVVNGGTIDIRGGTLAFTRSQVPYDTTVFIRTNVLLLETGAGFEGGLVSENGTIRVITTALASGSPITNLSGLTVDTAVALTSSGTIRGPGGYTKLGTSSHILTAVDNAWGAGTLISAGTLQIGDGGYNGSMPDIAITNNGVLYYNSALNFTNSLEISGTGSLTKRGNDGVLTITASNSFTGNINTGTGTAPQAGGIILLKNSYGFGNTNKTANIIRGELQLDGGVHTPTNITFTTSQNADITDMTWGGGYVAIRNMTGSNSINGPIILASGGGNSEFRVISGSLGLNGDITANTTARIMVLSGDAPGYVNGAITNNGANIPALQKRGANTWLLNAANTYSGNTTVREGTLALSATGSISNSPIIQMESNAVLNVSAVAGGFVLGTNQTLRGNGVISGNVLADGTVTPGLVPAETEIGTLVFNNSLTLAGITVMDLNRTNSLTADQIIANTLTYGGSLTITNIGDPLVAGDTFDLFNATSGSGTFALTSLPVLDTGLSWDTSGLYTSGVIKVIAGINLDKANLTYQVTGNTIQIGWPSDKIGMTLQAMTNAIAIGYSTNWFAVPGSTTTNSVTLPIDPANGTVFYRLVY